MPKRQVSSDCYSPIQRKIRITQKEINKGSQLKMNQVHQNTLSLLFSGAKNSKASPILTAQEVSQAKASENGSSRTLDSWVNVQSSAKQVGQSSSFNGNSSYMDSQPGSSGVQNGFSHMDCKPGPSGIQNGFINNNNNTQPGPSGIQNGMANMDSQPGPSGIQNGICHMDSQPGPSGVHNGVNMDSLPGPSGVQNGISHMDCQPGPSGVKSSIGHQKSLTSFFHVQNKQKPSRFQKAAFAQHSLDELGSQGVPPGRSSNVGTSRSFDQSSRSSSTVFAGSSTFQPKIFGKAISGNDQNDVPMGECTPESKSQCRVCQRDLGSFGTRCDYCDTGTCHSCLVQCSLCQGSFCSKCALPDYEADGDATKCLSCFN